MGFGIGSECSGFGWMDQGSDGILWGSLRGHVDCRNHSADLDNHGPVDMDASTPHSTPICQYGMVPYEVISEPTTDPRQTCPSWFELNLSPMSQI